MPPPGFSEFSSFHPSFDRTFLWAMQIQKDADETCVNPGFAAGKKSSFEPGSSDFFVLSSPRYFIFHGSTLSSHARNGARKSEILDRTRLQGHL